MEALLAGYVAGVAMGLVALGLYAPQVVGQRELLRGLQGRFPSGTSLPLLTAAGALFVQSLWSLLGLALGGVYWAIQARAQDGLGSPAWGFSLTMLALALLAAAAAVTVQPAWWRRVGLNALLFAAAFGWLLPNLAEA